jgi:hypothetical protein
MPLKSVRGRKAAWAHQATVQEVVQYFTPPEPGPARPVIRRAPVPTKAKAVKGFYYQSPEGRKSAALGG